MSTKTTAEKLGIKPNGRLWTSDADLATALDLRAVDPTLVERPEAADVAVIFASSAESLRQLLAADAGSWTATGRLWVAYPKGNAVDINRDTLWPHLIDHGMCPNGQCSLGDTWSALRFRPLKPGETFRGKGQR